MSKIIQLSTVKQERQISVEEAWARFVAAMEKSKRTLRLEDGIAAGKAYGEFCNLFRKAS